MTKPKKGPVHPISIIRNLSVNRIYGRLAKEGQYLQSLYYNLKVVGWDDFPIYPDGFSGNASFLYFIFKILQREAPEAILEIGSGQSTLLTTRYAKENPESKAVILEDSEIWFKKVQSITPTSDNITYIHSELKPLKLKRRKCLWYSTDILEKGQKFTFIIVDGPSGTYRRSRIGICKYLLDIIDPNNFIIIFDDTARKGEIDTIKYTKRIFKKKNIDFIQFHLHGTKRQTCLVSKNKAYLASEWNLY